MSNPRVIAAKILLQVINHGKSLNELLPEIKQEKTASLIQAFCYGVCRYYDQLDNIAQQLITKPLKSKDADINVLVLLGIYQLQYMRLPAHAVISETVNASVELKKVWAKGFLNALLRRFQRESAMLMEACQKDTAAYAAHPKWLYKIIRQAWPEQADSIFIENNQQAPLVLRINQQKMTRENYLNKLATANIVASAHPASHMGIILDKACEVTALPGYLEGEFSVQDGAAQLAAELLQVSAGHTVLDACAAPGGKTAHLLELMPDIKLLAIDNVAQRVARIEENLKRLQLNAEIKCADVLATNTWWHGELFDRILLDAPCSATGVIRRHPDIKLLRKQKDIEQLAAVQLAMLKTIWPLLKPQGLLLYATCSILPQENREVIHQFLQFEHSAKEVTMDAGWGIEQSHGRQILPGQDSMDGFYYCLLRKI